MDRALIDQATSMAVRLAGATRKAQWLDVTLEILAQTRPPPATTVMVALETCAAAGLPPTAGVLQRCIEALEHRPEGAGDPFVTVQRLAALAG